jgi:alkylated DNA repair dioxygenase AlkB
VSTAEPTALYSYEPHFVDDPDEVLRAVRDGVAWVDPMHSRRTASMGIPYNYAGASYPEADWHPRVWDLALRVQERCGFLPTNCLLNRYPTGEHTIGWHADDLSILAPGTGIAIVSLGDTRTLQLRRREGDGFHYERLELEHGSLLYMTQALQRAHKHAIKRQPGAGERISLSFRHLTHSPPPVTAPKWSER